MNPVLLHILEISLVMSIFLGSIFYLFYSMEKKAKEFEEKKNKVKPS